MCLALTPGSRWEVEYRRPRNQNGNCEIGADGVPEFAVCNSQVSSEHAAGRRKQERNSLLEHNVQEIHKKVD